ncbi:hypothetical protein YASMINEVIRUS_1419 [Yasminevirus sp. GU-2018]|uniref:Uncharacterized protein n=1 Tax=Yasminevirus sp. GU-2018 TaxID=2420051 RepID=A0A5K0UA69_9VIRU|nr:hypothetical protein YASMINEVIRUS_1419 [Yasminevirus sp. GU-2018]
MINVHFASNAEAKEILLSSDRYFEMMNPFERAVRMDVPYNPDTPISCETFGQYAVPHIVEWQERHKATVQKFVSRVGEALQSIGFKGKFPDRVTFILTNGKEDIRECAGYCRKNTVVLNTGALSEARMNFYAHELFHIFSQNNPELRDSLYNYLGFHRCNEVDLPDDVKAITLTNPDAPNHDVYIDVRLPAKEKDEQHDTAGTTIRCTPVLFYNRDGYGSFFSKLYIRLVRINQGSDGVYRAVVEDGKCVMYKVEEVENFFEQIGKCQYYFHPDEILATRFANIVVSSTYSNWELSNDRYDRNIQTTLFKEISSN